MPGTPWGQQAHLYHAQADRRAFETTGLQQGVLDPYDLKVYSNGAARGLIVNPGDAVVTGSHAGITRQGQYPVTVTGSEVLVAAVGHATLPRIDQVVLRVRDTEAQAGTAGDATSEWTVELLAGTATAGATLDNRNGAATLPASTLRLADVLVPATWNATFVDTTHIRDRRTWARGAHFSLQYTGGDFTLAVSPSTTDVFGDGTSNPNHGIRVECSGLWPLEIGFDSVIAQAVNTATVVGGIKYDGSVQTLTGGALDFTLFYQLYNIASGTWMRVPHYVHRLGTTWVGGSHTYSTWVRVTAGSASMTARPDFPTRMWFRELVGSGDTQNAFGLTAPQMGPFTGA